MNFKKRRHQKTINKNDQKVRRAQAERDKPPLSAVYPGVEHLAVRLDFYSPEGSILLKQDREFSPDDIVDLSAPCPGRCGDGRMDLEGKLAELIRRREVSSENRAQCRRPIYADAAEICGCELRCSINI